MTPEMQQKENGLADLTFWLTGRISEINHEIYLVRKESPPPNPAANRFNDEWIKDAKKMIARWEAVLDALDLAVGMARREHWLLGYEDAKDYIPLQQDGAA